MPIHAVPQVTSYRYRQRVTFGKYPMMLRPQEGCDQWLLKGLPGHPEAPEAKAEWAARLTAALSALAGCQRSRSALAIQTHTLPRQP